MSQRAPKKLALAVAASLSMSGCLPMVRFRPAPPVAAVPCEASLFQPMPDAALEYPLPVTASSPFVRIVGESAPYASFAELELLSAELHTELAYRGGVRLEDSALVAQQPQEACVPAACPGGDDSRRRSTQGDPSGEGKIRTMSAQLIDNSGQPGLHSTTFFPGGASHRVAANNSIEVAVIVNDFTPYRPMQLAATIIARDLSTGQEVHRIQRVWRGIVHEPEFETTRKKLNSDLRHPATRQRLEHVALPDISPRHLIKRVATEVADSLHQSVLKP